LLLSALLTCQQQQPSSHSSKHAQFFHQKAHPEFVKEASPQIPAHKNHQRPAEDSSSTTLSSPPTNTSASHDEDDNTYMEEDGDPEC